jgi:hypothetical protein
MGPFLRWCGESVLHCPNEGEENHPHPTDNRFLLLALIYVGPDFNFKRVQDHFLEDILCNVCGENAINRDD